MGPLMVRIVKIATSRRLGPELLRWKVAQLHRHSLSLGISIAPPGAT